MNILRLPDELIPNIALFLSLFEINNLLRTHSKFNNSFNFNWNQYFKYHLGIDIILNKFDLITYSHHLIEHFNHYYKNNHNSYILNQIIRGLLKTRLIGKLLLINKVVLRYRNNDLYNKLIRNGSPIFRYRKDFIEPYVGWTSATTKGIFSKYLGKVVIIADQLVISKNDAFGYEALNMIDKYNTGCYGEILIILT